MRAIAVRPEKEVDTDTAHLLDLSIELLVKIAAQTVSTILLEKSVQATANIFNNSPATLFCPPPKTTHQEPV